MDNILVEGLKPVTHIDLGWSEDAYNNFLIDMWVAMKETHVTGITMPVTVAAGETITVKLTHGNFLKIEEF